jgi:hypothetical protein
MLEMTISIGMEKRRKTRLIAFKPIVSDSRYQILLLTLGSRSENAATSMAATDVMRLPSA